MTRRLIEEWLPAAAIGAESLRERGSAKAYPPINFLHVWWARRPLTASRAAVLASLLPAWPGEEEAAAEPASKMLLACLQQEFPGGPDEYRLWFTQMLGILGDPVAGRAAIKAAVAAGRRTAGNAYGYERAFTVSPDEALIQRIRRVAAFPHSESKRPVVLDPFAGGGSIPFEASRFGLEAVASELNPVAAAILEGTVVLPARVGPQFSRVIRHWGDLWARRVRDRLDRFYPVAHEDERRAYIWAHAVPCPTTGRATPLAPNFWLSHGNELDVALQLDAVDDQLHLAIVAGASAGEWGSRATYRRGVGQSVWTGETFSGDYIRSAAQAGKLSQILLAVSVARPGVKGRRFLVPGRRDLEAAALAEVELAKRLPGWEVDDLVPTEPIPPGWKTDEPRRMGLRYWSDLFAPRQLLANVTALEELLAIGRDARENLDDLSARALVLYLAYALDRALNYNGRLSGWDPKERGVSNVFDRHDLAFKWTFAEFDGARALWPWTVDNAVVNHEKVSRLLVRQADLLSEGLAAEARVLRSSATSLPLESNSVDAVVTDPPYYDNVMYAEISDYFYVWLKRSLRESWPQFTDLVLTDKADEAVANPALFRDVAAPARRGRRRDGDGPTAAELADARYEELLRASFLETHRVLKDDGILTVMFTHKRVNAWDTLGAALLDAGFSINASWPVHTESEHSLHQARKNSAASTIFLACRKRHDSQPAYWADIRRDVEAAAEEAAHRFAEEGMTGVDLTIATYGPVLSVLSDRWPVYTGELGPDGQPEVLRPDAALDLAREKVAALKKRGLLGGRSVDFDRVTDWWLLAWNDFQAAEFPFDEARKLSIAMHLEVDEVAKVHKVVKASAGSVTLLTPAQRRTAGAIDPDETSFSTWLDRLHTLMLIYDEDGLAAARAWLNRTGLGGDARFRDVVQSALAAVPRVRVKGELVRPEAKTLESLRAALFEDIAAPEEPTAEPAMVQLGLLDAEDSDPA